MAQPIQKIQNALAWRYRRCREQIQDWRQGRKLARSKALMPDSEYDPRIKYPCYKSLDEFIDVERLKSLDDYTKERVKPFLESPDNPTFHSGPFKLKQKSPSRPGSRLIELSQSIGDFNYHDLNNPEAWEPSAQSKSFPDLMKFIDTLPFKSTARMIIMVDDLGRAVTAHRDHSKTEIRHEFIWFRTNLDKPFYVFDPRTEGKNYFTSYTAWFDTVNQFHGSDETGRFAISMRVDGIFTDEFRQHIPTPDCNPASTAALWASIS